MRVGICHPGGGTHKHASSTWLRRLSRLVKIVIGGHFEICREAVEPIVRPIHDPDGLNPLPSSRQEPSALLDVTLERTSPLSEMGEALCRVDPVNTPSNRRDSKRGKKSRHRDCGEQLGQGKTRESFHARLFFLASHPTTASPSKTVGAGSGTETTSNEKVGSIEAPPVKIVIPSEGLAAMR